MKSYLEEDLTDEAEAVLEAGLSEETMLAAPSLILPEFRHALDKRRRRGELSADEDEEIWNEFAGYPIFLEELESLMPAAVEVVRACGCMVNDALLAALAATACDEMPVLVTADERLIGTLEGTSMPGWSSPSVRWENFCRSESALERPVRQRPRSLVVEHYQRREFQCERDSLLLAPAFARLTIDSAQGISPGRLLLEPALCRGRSG